MTTLVWFRQDLRLADNPALDAARGAVVPVYLYAPGEEIPWAPGGASRWWLHHSLASLSEELAALGSRLVVRRCGDSLEALLRLARECGARCVHWNRRYEPAAIARDRHIKTVLREAGLEAHSFNGALLHEPHAVMTASGTPFQVFTPFWRHCVARGDPPGPPHRAPRPLPGIGRPPNAWRVWNCCRGRIGAPVCAPPGRRVPRARHEDSRNSSAMPSWTMPPFATGPTCPAPRDCRRICTSARYHRARSGTRHAPPPPHGRCRIGATRSS